MWSYLHRSASSSILFHPLSSLIGTHPVANPPIPCTSFTCINLPHNSHKTQTMMNSFRSPMSSPPKSLLQTWIQVYTPTDHTYVALALGVHIVKRSSCSAIWIRFRFRSLCDYGCACCGWWRVMPRRVAMGGWGEFTINAESII